MKTIQVTDATLSTVPAAGFREKVEILKELDRLGADRIEFSCRVSEKADTLLLHTVAPLLKHSTLSCVAQRSEAGIAAAWDALRLSERPCLTLRFPLSAVQMEYSGGCKPKALLAQIPVLVAYAVSLCPQVELIAEDATRSEPEVLISALRAAISAGATIITLNDDAGVLLPEEYADFLHTLYTQLPALEACKLQVACSDKLHMGAACMIAAIRAGASLVKTAIGNPDLPSVGVLADVLKLRAESLQITTGLQLPVLHHAVARIEGLLSPKQNGNTPFTTGVRETEEFCLQNGDALQTVLACVQKLGYELSEEDAHHVYESFLRVSRKKNIGVKELEAIVASVALDVAPTYKLRSYVANSSNVMSATAQIELEKEGALLQGISLGDGPIDAAFLAIEGIVGHHFELDDFQLRSVTEGREAMGEALVKLREGGRLYSGRGLSTDIIGASIRAYINALNKICYEEGQT